MKETFTLTIRALPSDVPVMIRLRRILKGLLRSYDFRCVSIVPVDQGGVVACGDFQPQGDPDNA